MVVNSIDLMITSLHPSTPTFITIDQFRLDGDIEQIQNRSHSLDQHVLNLYNIYLINPRVHILPFMAHSHVGGSVAEAMDIIERHFPSTSRHIISTKRLLLPTATYTDNNHLVRFKLYKDTIASMISLTRFPENPLQKRAMDGCVSGRSMGLYAYNEDHVCEKSLITWVQQPNKQGLLPTLCMYGSHHDEGGGDIVIALYIEGPNNKALEATCCLTNQHLFIASLLVVVWQYCFLVRTPS
eukprot:scaffold7912_cov113-Skeletonema_marinoi.AAC.6